MRSFVITVLSVCLLATNIYGQCSGVTDNRIWMVDANNDIVVVNPVTNASRIVGNTGLSFYDIAYHPNGNLYGVRNNGDIYTIDTTFASASFLTKLTGLGNPNAMICDGDGTCYVASMGDLVTLDVTDGSSTTILSGQDFRSMGDFLFKDGLMYLAAENRDNRHADFQEPSLYLIDLENATSSLVGKFSPAVDVYGLANSADGTTYATAGTGVYKVDLTTAALSYAMPASTVEAYGLTSTGDFCQSHSVILPIELVEFEAEVVNGMVALNWSTATELNSDTLRSSAAWMASLLRRLNC